MQLEVSMATPTRRQFTDAFKSEAVRLTRESGWPVAQLVRKLRIADNLLYRLGQCLRRKFLRDAQA